MLINQVLNFDDIDENIFTNSVASSCKSFNSFVNLALEAINNSNQYKVSFVSFLQIFILCTKSLPDSASQASL